MLAQALGGQTFDETGAGGDRPLGIPPMDMPNGGAANAPSEPSKPPELRECQLESIQVIPSELSERDGCQAIHACENDSKLIIDCDGENDGTNTSLCTCQVGTKRVDVGGVIEGEAPASCETALAGCLSIFGG